MTSYIPSISPRDPTMIPSTQVEVPPSPPASISELGPEEVIPDARDGDLERIVSTQDFVQPPTPGTSQPQQERTTYGTMSVTRKKGKRRVGRRRLRLEGPFMGQWNPALTLENTGSVARDHLASERTFLAYVRTSLTIASSGVALVQLFNVAATTGRDVGKYSEPLGAIVILIGFLTLCLGVARYFSVQTALVNGNYTVARVSPASLAFALMAAIIAAFGVLLGARRLDGVKSSPPFYVN